MVNALLVGLGGFIGSVFRYAISGYIQHWSDSVSFPYGTLFVNMVGCLAIGFSSQLAESYGVFSSDSRAFLFIGFLGGFTTYSAFGNETINLLRSDQALLALTNVAAHIGFGLGAVWVGRISAFLLWR